MWPLVVFYFIASVMKLSWLWTAVGLAATMSVTLWLKSKLYLPQQNMVMMQGVTGNDVFWATVRAAFFTLFRRKYSRASPPPIPKHTILVPRVELVPKYPFIASYHRITSSDKVSTSLITAIHCVQSKAALMLFSHQGFPLPVLGSVHTRSYIKIDDVTIFDSPSRLVTTSAKFRPVKRGTEGVVDLKVIDLTTALPVAREELNFMLFHPVNEKSALPRDFINPPEPDFDPSQLLNTFECSYDVTQLFAMYRHTKTRQIIHPTNVAPKLKFFVAVVVPPNIGRQFAALCGDYNPIHVHSIFAKLFGFKTAIAHGMWVCGRALSFIEQVPGWTGQNVIELEVFFRKPVPMPSKAKVEFFSPPPLVTNEDNLPKGVTIQRPTNGFFFVVSVDGQMAINGAFNFQVQPVALND